MSTNLTDFFEHNPPARAGACSWMIYNPQPSPISNILQHLDWSLVNTIEHEPSRFNILIKHRPLIMAQYRVQAAHLVHLANKKPKDDPALIQEIEKTLKMTVLLKKIYHHIDEPDDVNRAAVDQAILETILFKLSKPNSPSPIKLPSLQASSSQQLRTLILNTNLSRLTGIRIRRFLLACMTFEWFALCRQPITQIEQFTNPFFAYLSWIFFFPRLFLNLTSFSQQVISNPWMSKEKRNLPWYLRADAYLNLHRRGFEFWGDVVWFTGGVLLCFVLIGPMAYCRPFFIVAMQVSDLIMMLTRSIIELNRLMILKNEYYLGVNQGLQLPNPGYLNALEERITFEKKVSFLVITNNTLMVISVMTMLPVLIAMNPLFPILGALLALAATMRFSANNTALESKLPRTNLNLLLKHYDTTPVSPAPQPQGRSLINTLAVPTVITLTPLLFLSIAYSPAISLLLSIALLTALASKILNKPKEEYPLETNFKVIVNHSFFKSAPASPSQQLTETRVIELKPSGPSK